MPSPPTNAAPVLLLAPPDALLHAPADEAAPAALVIAAAPPRRTASYALLLSLVLHLLAAGALWHWAAEIVPEPESPVLQVRLRAGGATPASTASADLPPAPPAPAAAEPKPRQAVHPTPAAAPRAPAKTATTPVPVPVASSQPPLPELPASPAPVEAERSGTDVLTPPVDPLVNTATVRVLEWLAQHRRYPGPARRAKLQGTVEVIVVLMPDGRLVDQRIAQSSGHAILDKAALDLLRRASPVPASAFFTGEARQLELRLPIIYRLSI